MRRRRRFGSSEPQKIHKPDSARGADVRLFGGKTMPNPKHKHSRARRDKRRTQKLRVTPPGMSVCPQCHELKLPHYTCLNCGTYKGKAVIQVEEV
ncbi:MAG TPA: 50S ribosomal protein L32 [Nitrospira sp.]|nr:50S ribosomal protein L32 [Nitrospira sp.]